MAKELNECLCGCGGATARRFVPGHDARLKGVLQRMFREGTPADRERALERAEQLGWMHFMTEKPVRRRRQKFTEVKVGRWTYPLVRVATHGAEAEVVYRKKDGTEVEATVPVEKLVA